jgi:hypothetical protein
MSKAFVVAFAVLLAAGPNASALSFSDDFEDGDIHSFWWRVSGAAGRVTEGPNELRMAVDPTGSVSLAFSMRVRGDFTATVDFTLQYWTPGTNMSVSIRADAPTETVAIAIRGAAAHNLGPGGGDADGYAFFGNQAGVSVGSSDTAGWLLVSRTGTNFFAGGSGIFQVGNSTAQTVTVTLQLSAQTEIIDSLVELDNFLLTAPAMPDYAPCADNAGATTLPSYWIVLGGALFDSYSPAVACNSWSNEFLVVWEAIVNVTNGILAGRVSTNIPLPAAVPVVLESDKTNFQPCVAFNSAAGEYLVVYTRMYSGTDYDIYALRLNGDGAPVGPPLVLDYTSALQQHPAVAYNPARNEYLVAYERHTDAATREIVVQRLDAYGGLITQRVAAGDSGVMRTRPDVAYNEARDEYLLAYTRGVDAAGDIYGRRLSGEASVLNVETGICADAYAQDRVSLAAGPDEYLAAWEDGLWGTEDFNIYARRITGDGTPQAGGGGMPIATDTAWRHSAPDVAFCPPRGYVVTWSFSNTISTLNDVYGRWVLPGSDVTFGGPFPLDNDSYVNTDPAVACGPDGLCLFAEESDSGVAEVKDWVIAGFFKPEPPVITHIVHDAPWSPPRIGWDAIGCGWQYQVQGANAPSNTVWSFMGETWKSEWTNTSFNPQGPPAGCYRIRAGWLPEY